MPLCEAALLLAGKSDQQRLRHALDVSFKHHAHLERVRKVDDHAEGPSVQMQKREERGDRRERR